MKEEYLAIKVVLEKLDYNAHHWMICVDLKNFNFFFANKVSSRVSCACGIAEQETNIGIKNTDENVSDFKYCKFSK